MYSLEVHFDVVVESEWSCSLVQHWHDRVFTPRHCPVTKPLPKLVQRICL
jgi:hypothetical protein